MPIALITGSTGGLGQEFARIHAQRGGDLILVGRNASKLEQQANALHQRYGVKITRILADLSQDSAAQEIYDFCQRKQLLPDYIINNAGFGGQGDFARQRSLEDDSAMLAVNITAPTQLLKLFLPDMITRGSGKVLNVSSIASLTPGPLQAVYFATKAYITSWSQALAKELEDTNVTVTCLLPAAMNTGFIQAGNLEGTELFRNTGLVLV